MSEDGKNTVRGASFALIFCLSGTSALAGGPVCAVADNIWRNGHSDAQTEINDSVDEMAAMVATESGETTEQLTSVVRLITGQNGAEGQRGATASVKAAEALANAVNEQRSREAVIAAEENYGPLGQAVDTCYTAGVVARVQEAFDSIGDNARAIVGLEDIDVRPGAVNDVDDVLQRRVSRYTPASINVAGSILNPNAEEPDLNMFMNYVFGAPLRKPRAVTPGVEAGVMMLAARRAEALRSPALLSMSAVRSMYHSRGHLDVGGDDPSALSTMEGLDWLIGRYGGGEEHEAWAAELATKSEAGLLKEINRLRGISLQIQRLRMESQARVQPVLATLLSAEIDG